jgi:hypothetical protein
VITRSRGGKKCGSQVSVEEEADAVGLDPGQAEGPSAICPHGRDQDGRSAPEEDSVEDSGGAAIRTFALDFHGFLDGGGLIQATTNFPVTDMGINSTPTKGTSKKMKGG